MQTLSARGKAKPPACPPKHPLLVVGRAADNNIQSAQKGGKKFVEKIEKRC